MRIAKLLRKYKKVLLLSLLVVGPMVAVIGFFMLFYERAVLSFSGVPEAVDLATNRKSQAVRIVVDDLGIDLAIEEGRIINGIWEISKKGASHLNISANPSEGGNIVIYGHNKKYIFGSLPYIWIGDTVKIVNKNGETFKYKVTMKTSVKPDDLTYVLPKDEETLTIYTCTGFLDTLRSIVVAKPI